LTTSFVKTSLLHDFTIEATVNPQIVLSLKAGGPVHEQQRLLPPLPAILHRQTPQSDSSVHSTMSTQPSSILTPAQSHFVDAKYNLTALLHGKISEFRAHLVILARENETRRTNMTNTLGDAAPARTAKENQKPRPDGSVTKTEHMKALCVQYTLLLVMLEGTLKEEVLEEKGAEEVTEYLVSKTAELTELTEEFKKELKEVEEIVEEDE
jgi:hypothetical protein